MPRSYDWRRGLLRSLIPLRVVALLLLLPGIGRAQKNTIHLYDPSDVSIQVDYNGFLFNPAWHGIDANKFDPKTECYFRVLSGELSERRLAIRSGHCLSEVERKIVTLNEAAPGLGFGLICQTNGQLGELRGHVNWFPVTATGRLVWDSYSGDFGADDDLTFKFFTPQPSAATKINDWDHDVSSYHIEFYRKETLGHLGLTGSTWWHAINAALDQKKKVQQREMAELVNDRFAIVNGTFNLDGVHYLHAELHPVFLMAVLVEAKPTGTDRIREEWAIMARNIGNQGDCSGGKLPLRSGDAATGEQRIILNLGWWREAASATATLGEATISRAGMKPRFGTVANKCACLEFDQRRPTTVEDDEDYFYGTVYVDWVRAPQEGIRAASGPTFPTARFAEDHWVDTTGFAPLKFKGLEDAQFRAAAAETQKVDEDMPGGKVVSEATKREAVDRRKNTATKGVQSLDPLMADPTTPKPTQVPRSTALLESKIIEPLPCGGWFQDPLCLVGRRFIASPLAFNATTNTWEQSASFYVYPHGVDKFGDKGGIFGYRVDARRDHFRPRRDTILKNGVLGFSGQLSGVWQPGTFWAKSTLSVSPFAFIGPGFVSTRIDGFSFEIQRGTGVEVRWHKADFSIDYRHNYFFRRYDESTVWGLAYFIRSF